MLCGTGGALRVRIAPSGMIYSGHLDGTVRARHLNSMAEYTIGRRRVQPRKLGGGGSTSNNGLDAEPAKPASSELVPNHGSSATEASNGGGSGSNDDHADADIIDGIDGEEPPHPFVGAVVSMTIGLDGTVWTGCMDQNITAWKPVGHELHLLKRMVGHEGGVITLANGGGWVVSGSLDCTVRVWDAAAGGAMGLVHTYRRHTAMVVVVAVAPGGDVAYSGSNDKLVMVYDLKTLTVRHVLEGHTDCVSSLAAVSGTMVLSGSDDCTIRCWTCSEDAAADASSALQDGGSNGGSGSNKGSNVSDGGKADAPAMLAASLTGHTDYILSLRLIPSESSAAVLDGEEHGLLVSTSCDTTIRIWSLTTMSCLRVLASHSALISGLEM